MKIRNLILAVGIAGIALLITQGCSSSKNITDTQLSDKWVLKSIDGKSVGQAFENSIPHITLNTSTKQISGNSGCNNFNGIFSYVNGKFSAPNLASTMMACVFKNEEPLFMAYLAEKSTLSIENGDLIFTQNNQPVLVFARAQPLGASDLAGTWTLSLMEGRSPDFDFIGTIPTLEFNFFDNSITGNAGCNRYNSSFQLKDNIITIERPVTTRMMCENMAGENKFVNLLPGESNLEIENNWLYLKRNGIVVMAFSK